MTGLLVSFGSARSDIGSAAPDGGHDLQFLGDVFEGGALRQSVERIKDGLFVSHGTEEMDVAAECKFAAPSFPFQPQCREQKGVAAGGFPERVVAA